jgi:hypothetical protein
MNLNPDAFLIERVFQPMVDRFRIDPIKAKKALYRFMTIASIGSFLIYWSMTIRTDWISGSSPLPILLTLLLLMGFIATTGLHISGRGLAGGPAIDRAEAMPPRIGMVVIFLLMTVMAYWGFTSDLPVTSRILGITFSLSMMMGAPIVYLHECNPPPPPGRRREALPLGVLVPVRMHGDERRRRR